ncbi:hypothetical protein SK128_021511 [Halocaridina rubra]|uniref:Inorganic phosphate cotransporter n=1 Tax=Halocaridina rubra TaxID=373956 RepID=A0AAN8XMB0_HALRR
MNVYYADSTEWDIVFASLRAEVGRSFTLWFPYKQIYCQSKTINFNCQKTVYDARRSLQISKFSPTIPTGSYAPALGLLILSLTGCDPMAAVLILCISTAVSGAVFCGYFCSHQDLSPNLSGTLYGLTNTVANSTGFIAPAVAGLILYENQTLRAWNTIFYISGVVYVVTCTFYCLFISVEVQDFNNPKSLQPSNTLESVKLCIEKNPK